MTHIKLYVYTLAVNTYVYAYVYAYAHIEYNVLGKARVTTGIDMAHTPPSNHLTEHMGRVVAFRVHASCLSVHVSSDIALNLFIGVVFESEKLEMTGPRLHGTPFSACQHPTLYPHDQRPGSGQHQGGLNPSEAIRVVLPSQPIRMPTHGGRLEVPRSSDFR